MAANKEATLVVQVLLVVRCRLAISWPVSGAKTTVFGMEGRKAREPAFRGCRTRVRNQGVINDRGAPFWHPSGPEEAAGPTSDRRQLSRPGLDRQSCKRLSATARLGKRPLGVLLEFAGESKGRLPVGLHLVLKRLVFKPSVQGAFKQR